jgi:putative ABC transport system permease protein
MSSRWKKVWADFWGNKSRTVLTILTIMVGTFAVGFTSNMNLYMIESMDGDYLSANPSEATVYAYPMDQDMVQLARAVPGVDAVEGRSSVSGQLIRSTGEPLVIQFTRLDNPNALSLNFLKPVPGETNLPALADKQLLVDASAASVGYKVGDVILVELNDGKRRELTLTGYIHDVTGIPFAFTNTFNAYVTRDTLQWLGGDPDHFSELAVSVSEKQTDAEHVTEVAQAVADRIKRAGASDAFVVVYQPGHHFAYNISQAMFFLLGVLGYLTVLLSGFLIVNTITALMTQQTRQIGIMKATGGGTAQIFGMYVILILAFGLGALAIAVPLANVVTKSIGGGMAAWLNFNPAPYKGYSATFLQQAIVALIFPLLAAVRPIYNSVRVTVREALSDYGIGGDSKPPKHTSVSKRALLLSRPIRLSLRNTFRRKTRLALTLFTLTLGGAIFIAVYNLWASFDQSMKEVQGYFLADINIPFGRYYRFEEVASIAQNVPGVSSVEGWTQYGGTLIRDRDQAGTQIIFTAPPSTSTLIKPVITSGRWLKTGDENAVVIGNHLLSMFPDLKAGDWLTIDIDGKATRWQIIGTYVLVGNVGIPYLYVNYEYLSRLIGRPDQVYSVRVLTEQHDGDTQKRISNQIEALYEQRGIRFGTPQLGADFIRDQKATTDILVYFMLVMAILIAIVGGLGLAGTMSINVLERTREIGVMRAIGASNLDIQSIVIIEGLVVGLISWAVAILLSFPITNVLCYGVGIGIMTAPLPPVYSGSGIIVWLVGVLILATVSSALPARGASRLTVKDTLAYE